MWNLYHVSFPNANSSAQQLGVFSFCIYKYVSTSISPLLAASLHPDLTEQNQLCKSEAPKMSASVPQEILMNME